MRHSLNALIVKEETTSYGICTVIRKKQLQKGTCVPYRSRSEGDELDTKDHGKSPFLATCSIYVVVASPVNALNYTSVAGNRARSRSRGIALIVHIVYRSSTHSTKAALQSRIGGVTRCPHRSETHTRAYTPLQIRWQESLRETLCKDE